ncbi:MAG: YifB family Mg chelatase-like AAA ATPase [Aquificae bacterium]|nr:YifB family Mg chelatase-like AAA ATPase [Aquificota bacterium]
MFVKLLSAAYLGLETFPVEVQVDVSPGLPLFSVVGLADTAVKEAKERVRAAVKNSGFSFPSRRITVNLSPSDRRKAGSHFDLPIALALLAASGQWDPSPFADAVFLGELALGGEVKPVRGVLAMVLGLKRLGFRRFVVPPQNAGELELLKGIEVYSAASLEELVKRGPRRVEFKTPSLRRESPLPPLDLADVRGQRLAKRMLEVAAAGFHHAAMVGAPGSGKSMLAKRLPTLMPPMEEWEVLEVSQVYSVAGLLEGGLITERPFRSPHYTASEAALIGGGKHPTPGEVSLAHRGVLFLDELPEFNRKVLEVLRQPLEEGKVLVSRAEYKVEFPARFLWVSALNPCPCGNYKHPFKECVCTPAKVRRYLRKVSSPLWERIDLKVWVNPPSEAELLGPPDGESSAVVRKRVEAAVALQKERNPGGKFNGELTNAEVEKVADLDPKARAFLEKVVAKVRLSARSYYKLLKVSRTLADLEGSPSVKVSHVSEALNLTREPLEVQ